MVIGGFMLLIPTIHHLGVEVLREYRERLDWSPLIKFNYVNVVLFPFFLVLIGGARERPEIKRKEVSLEEAAHH